MLGLLLDYGLMALVAYIIFKDVKKQGKNPNLFWMWLLAMAVGYLFLQIIGIAVVFTIYLVWGRYQQMP